jgi:hypothetical protein
MEQALLCVDSVSVVLTGEAENPWHPGHEIQPDHDFSGKTGSRQCMIAVGKR